MSEKPKGEVKKTVDKPIVVRFDPPKKIHEKSKPEPKKNHKDGKREGRIFKDSGVQTEPMEIATDSSLDDLTTEGNIQYEYEYNISL